MLCCHKRQLMSQTARHLSMTSGLCRWFPTALWTHTSNAVARWLPTAEPEIQSVGIKSRIRAPARLLASSSRSLGAQSEPQLETSSQQPRSSAQQSMLYHQQEDDEQDESLASDADTDPSKATQSPGYWRWLPWKSSNTQHAAQVNSRSYGEVNSLHCPIICQCMKHLETPLLTHICMTACPLCR